MYKCKFIGLSLFCTRTDQSLYEQHEDSAPTTEEPTDTTTPTEPDENQPTTDDFENCKQLDESLTLSWTVDRSAETVLFMLCGCTSADTDQ